jgi:hypothetical protein
VRTKTRHSRLIHLTALTAWPVALGALILHITGVFTSIRGFDLTDAWLVAIGSVGTPPCALRALGRVATPRGLIAAGSGFCAAAITVSVLDLAGQLHPLPSDRLVGLFLLLVPAVRCFGAASDLSSAIEYRAEQRAELQAAVARARREHREGCVLFISRREQALDRMLDAVTDLDTADAELIAQALQRRSAARQAATTVETVIPFAHAGHLNGHGRHT